MGVSFVAVGNFNIDNVVTADGTVTLQNIGGNAVFSAIGAHIWSTSVGICSRIPENYPLVWPEELERVGIDLSGVRRIPPAVDREEWFFYLPDGSRIDHIYAPSDGIAERFGGHNGQLSLNARQVKELLDWVRSYPAEAGISIGGFHDMNPILPESIPEVYWPIHGCHISPNVYSVQLALARAFKTKGVLVSLDPSIDTASSLNDAKDGRSRLASLLAEVDVFLPSMKELHLLCPGMENREAIASLASLPPNGSGPRVIGVKLGSQGSLIWDRHRDQFVHIPVFPSQVKDLTGAGDAYCGGFLVGMIETGDPLLAAQYGSVSASLLIERDDVPTALRFNRYQANLRLSAFQSLSPIRLYGKA